MPTLIVDVGLVHDVAVVVVVEVVVVVVAVVVVVVVTLGGVTLTPNVPFIPTEAWPLTVQRKVSFPFLLNTTFRVVDCPGLSSFVFLPLILKSCSIFPLFVTLKITVVPLGTLLLDSANLNSVAVTLIVTVFEAEDPAPIAGIANGAAAPAAPTTRSANKIRTRCNEKPPLKDLEIQACPTLPEQNVHPVMTL